MGKSGVAPGGPFWKAGGLGPPAGGAGAVADALAAAQRGGAVRLRVGQARFLGGNWAARCRALSIVPLNSWVARCRAGPGMVRIPLSSQARTAPDRL